ncbi:MAG: cell division protein FtsW, partial [Alphaproteobacteria bacterium HGW-Alphaproteobacteria-2]
MTEMVHGMAGAVPREPVLPRWWRSIDRWSLGCVLMLLGIGLLLGLAASPPLAARHNLPPFHYVERQALFGVVAVLAILGLSMCDPRMLRRIGVVGCLVAIAALLLLPVFGTDFNKGAVRWFSLGFASLQPSEFLKPCLVVLCAWLMAAATEIGGPPGRLWSFLLTIFVALLLALQPDFGQAVLVLFGWGVMYFIGGAPIVLLLLMLGGTVFAGTLVYQNSEHFARRIDGFLAAEIDPRTQIGFATDAIREGGFFGVGVGEGRVKWSLPDAQTDFIIAVAAEEYGLVLVL